MNKLLSFLIFALVCAAATKLYARERPVFGVVTDERSGEPLPSVNIEAKDEAFGTTTNEIGYYVVSVTKDSSTLMFSHIGYKPKAVPVFMEGKMSLRLNVVLSPASLLGDTVIVTSPRFSTYDQIGISMIRLQPRALQSVPQFAGESDLIRTLQSLPGVTSLNEFQSQLYVRGGRPGQNLVLMDGAELYHITHLYGIYSMFNMYAVKQVSLMKGGFPARYGNRVSSVLNIINKEGNRNQFEGDIHLGLISSKASLQGPIGNGSWFLAGRRTYYDYLVGRRSSLPEYYFYDLNAKLTQQITPDDIFTLSLYHGNDTFVSNKRTPGRLEQETQRWGNQLVSTRWLHQFNIRLWGDLMLTYTLYRARRHDKFLYYDNSEVVSYSDFHEAVSLLDYTVKSSLQYHYDKAHTANLGLELKRLQLDYAGSWSRLLLNDGDSLFASEQIPAVQADVYWQDNWQVTPRLHVQSGVRLSTFSSSSKIQASPRLAIKYRVTNKATLKAAWGRYVQYVSQLRMVEYNDNAQISGDDQPLFGNFNFFLPAYQSIPPTKAYHYIIGIESFPGDGIQVSLEGYYKQIYGIPDWKSETDRISNIYRRVRSLQNSSLATFVEVGNGQAYGGELLIRKQTGKLTGWLGYTLSRTELEYVSINEGKIYPAMYDRTHDLAIIAQYDAGGKWSVSLAWFYATGQPYTPYNQRKNSERLRPYHRLDISLVRTYHFASWELKTYLQIFNAYNRKNTLGKIIKVRGDKVTAEWDIRTLPIIPTIGIEVSF